MSHDPDPFSLVLNHCDVLAPPTWIDEQDTRASRCYHCSEKFIPFLQIGRISKHHCRLCGQMCCRSCTSKLKVPPKFEKKGKSLSRVCHGCMLSVLVRRVLNGETLPAVKSRVMKYAWGGVEPRTNEERQKISPKVFHIPEWANVHDTPSCYICAVITERRHHCRLCGFLFCDDCSQKLSDVPQSFDQKNKPGGKRVCDYCRWCLARGWRFAQPGEKPPNTQTASQSNGASSGGVRTTVQPSPASSPAYTPAAAASPLSPSPSSAPRITSSAAPPPRPLTRPSAISIHSQPSPSVAASSKVRPLNQCSFGSCQLAASVGGLCSTHDIENSALPKNSPVTFEVIVRLRFEEDSQPFGQLSIIGHADLHAINNHFSTLFPRVDLSLLQYVVRGRAVQKMHWRMFEARFVLPELVLKKTHPFDHRTSIAAASPQPAVHISSAPHTPNLPPTHSPIYSSPSPLSSRGSSPTRSMSQLTRAEMLAQSKPSRGAHRVSPATSRVASPQPSRQGSPSTSPYLAQSPPPLALNPNPLRLGSNAGSPSITSTRPPITVGNVPPPMPNSVPKKKWPIVQC